MMSRLNTNEKNLLSYLENIPFDVEVPAVEVGKALGIHRRTMTRILARIRDQVTSDIYKAMKNAGIQYRTHGSGRGYKGMFVRSSE